MGVTKWRFSSFWRVNPFGSIFHSPQVEMSCVGNSQSDACTLLLALLSQRSFQKLDRTMELGERLGCGKRKGPDRESGPRRAFWDRLSQRDTKEIALETPDCKHTIPAPNLFE
jgi:hypothetical protein